MGYDIAFPFSFLFFKPIPNNGLSVATIIPQVYKIPNTVIPCLAPTRSLDARFCSYSHNFHFTLAVKYVFGPYD